MAKTILYKVAASDAYNIYGVCKIAVFDWEAEAKEVAEAMTAKSLEEKHSARQGLTWIKYLYFTTAKSGKWEGEGGQKMALENAIKNGMHRREIEEATACNNLA